MTNETMSINNIIGSGCCIGCGACAADPANGIRISFDSQGRYQAAVLPEKAVEAVGRIVSVCPFSDESENEDQIGKRLFAGAQHDSRLGYFRSLYIGYVQDGEIRSKAASGGVVTWLLRQLVEADKADYVIHVKKADRTVDGRLFKYAISGSPDEIIAGAKTRYYPVEISEVISQVRAIPGRYVFVGIPCFVKAVRSLMSVDTLVRERVVACVGLVCGHLKSKAFADCFGWQAGITPGQLEEIDFRVKRTDAPAGDYAVWLKGGGVEVTRPARSFFGSNWGHNFFRYEACDFCDDVFAETADIAVGDAWLRPYIQDPKGTSIVVVRDAALLELLQNARAAGRLHLEDASVSSLVLSQAGGLRDRREGLAYRLSVREKQGLWAPKKRVAANQTGIGLQRRRIYESRFKMGRASHELWQVAVKTQSFAAFEAGMGQLVEENDRLYNSRYPRYVHRIKKLVKHLLSADSISALKKALVKKL